MPVTLTVSTLVGLPGGFLQVRTEYISNYIDSSVKRATAATMKYTASKNVHSRHRSRRGRRARLASSTAALHCGGVRHARGQPGGWESACKGVARAGGQRGLEGDGRPTGRGHGDQVPGHLARERRRGRPRNSGQRSVGRVGHSGNIDGRSAPARD